MPVCGVAGWWLYMVQQKSTIVLWEMLNTEQLNSIFLVFHLQIQVSEYYNGQGILKVAGWPDYLFQDNIIEL